MAELEQHIIELFQKKGWNVELDSFQDCVTLRVNGQNLVDLNLVPFTKFATLYFYENAVAELAQQPNITLKMLDILHSNYYDKCWIGKQHNHRKDVDEPIICFGEYYDIDVPAAIHIFELISILI